MGFLGMVNCYTLRVNLSVALVQMVNMTYVHELEASAKHWNMTDGSSHDVCAVEGDKDVNKTVDEIYDDVRMQLQSNENACQKFSKFGPIMACTSHKLRLVAGFRPDPLRKLQHFRLPPTTWLDYVKERE